MRPRGFGKGRYRSRSRSPKRRVTNERHYESYGERRHLSPRRNNRRSSSSERREYVLRDHLLKSRKPPHEEGFMRRDTLLNDYPREKYSVPDPSLKCGGSSGVSGRGMFVDGVTRTYNGLPSNEMGSLNSRGGNFLSSSSSGNFHKGEDDLRYRNRLNPTRDEKSVFSSRNVAYPTIGMSQSKALQIPSSAYQKDEYTGARTMDSARDQNNVSYLRGTYSRENRDYATVRREKDYPGYHSDEVYRKMQPSTQEDYVPSRKHSVDLVENTFYDTKGSRGRPADGSIRDHQSLQDEPVSSYPNMNRKLARVREAEPLSTGSKYLEFGARVSGKHGNSQPTRGHGLGVEAGHAFYKERLISPPRPEHDPDMYRLDASPPQRSRVEEVDKYDQFAGVQKRKYSKDEETSIHEVGDMDKYDPLARVQKRNYGKDEESMHEVEEVDKYDPLVRVQKRKCSKDEERCIHEVEEVNKYYPLTRMQKRKCSKDEERSIHEVEDVDKYDPLVRVQKRRYRKEEEMNTHEVEVVDKYDPLVRVQKRRYRKEEEMNIHEVEDADKYDPLVRVQKRNYSTDEEMNIHGLRITVPSCGNSSRQVQDLSNVDEQSAGEDVNALPSSEKSKPPRKKSAFSRLQYKKVRVSATQRLSLNGQGCATKHSILNGGRPSIKKRLTLVPLNVQGLEGRQDLHKSKKSQKRSLKDRLSIVHEDTAGASEGKVLPVKADPPEKSEEFKQLVHRAFLRYSKQLNETPAQRRRYKEQGEPGSLLCSVCGSPNQFVDTRSLVSHAFSSFKVGLRADHLGLHQALCVLMGWNSVVVPGSTWAHQVLPIEEALAVKEDLIVWPPVVIVHNSSIGSKSPDDRKLVSVEEMQTVLRDIGFSLETTKVCRGKPANHSIMVVKFMPTFSGLQEAERLHKYYADKKHGREEFQQITSNKCNIGEESREVPVDKLEFFLYGYLGISEDLDKLEFETKKRSVVKSKKDIQTIADAPVETD